MRTDMQTLIMQMCMHACMHTCIHNSTILMRSDMQALITHTYIYMVSVYIYIYIYIYDKLRLVRMLVWRTQSKRDAKQSPFSLLN
jgi:hypothetical protein